MGTDTGWAFLEVIVPYFTEKTKSSAMRMVKTLVGFRRLRVSEIVVQDSGRVNRLGKLTCDLVVMR